MSRQPLQTVAGQPSHGRRAEYPQDIPAPGWRDILMRSLNDFGEKDLGMISAGIAFYGLLALFPAIAALIAIGGLVIDPVQIERWITSVSHILPPEAASIIIAQADQVAAAGPAKIRFAAIFGLVFTLFTASAGMRALIKGLNHIYHESERRGLIQFNLVAYGLTLGLMLFVILALVLIAIVPSILAFVGLRQAVESLFSFVRWPLLFLFAMGGLSVLYRFAPSRSRAQWQWVSAGALLATLFWMAGSAGFSVYVRHFASYNETYGSLGAVIILLMWFWLSALAVLLGALLNANMEYQSGSGTTTGAPQEMERQDASIADARGGSSVD